jgi:glyoxylase-like metal-dependent hydrolase (beta-lactamase superfamily II)
VGDNMIRVETIVNGIIGNNTYLVMNDKNEAILIDPSSGVEKIADTISQYNCKVKYILLTHGHYDHFWGLDPLQREYGAEVLIHNSVKDYLKKPELNLSVTSAVTRKNAIVSYVKPRGIKEGDLNLEGFNVYAFYNPGHTKGCTSFIFDNEFMFSGDFIFKNTIGRTDFFDSNLKSLKDNIQRLTEKYDNLKILPGHGPATTLKQEKKNNPFFK